ncbi:hypothetical protein BDV41DRAFT_542968 [Aspergillus transmontanensis]|uniref:C2H2-type domain-containing protein n=1 Tax=Aspergillus transmontanensis TaxID=1034304 RepID=A0A5N6VRG4_9EURO|nr:hypothetical protein BDV41DRAFT_542968 [Aspergillus transmontanensis]
MADTPNTSAALPQHAAPFHIPSHNIAPCPGCENIGPLKGDFNMDPLSLSPECIPLTLFNSYPQSPFKNSLDERITNPGPATQGEPEVGLDMHLSTTSQLSEVVGGPRNHTAIHNHNCVNLGLNSTRWNTAFEDNTALDHQHGNLVRNLMVAPTIPPVQFQSRVGQHNVHTNVNQSAKDARPILRCKWEGCTSRRHFNREADLVRHIKTIHISPRSYKCAIENCSKTYNRGDNLKEHMLKVHQISHDA